MKAIGILYDCLAICYEAAIMAFSRANEKNPLTHILHLNLKFSDEKQKIIK